MYDLLVVDLDGTLLNDQKEISEENRRAISYMKEKKKAFSVCTGRNLFNTLAIAESLQLDAPIVCSDGAVVYFPERKVMLKEHFMNEEEVNTIIQIGNEYTGYIEITTSEQYIKYIKNTDYEKYDIKFSLAKDDNRRVFIQGISRKYDLNFGGVGPIHQIIFGGEEEILSQIVKEIPYADIVNREYLWKNYLFLGKESVSKSRGMQELCEYFHTDHKKTIAMGDDLNDFDMLQKAGVGIAMGNACQKIKQVADEVCNSNNDHGVAEIIYKYF